MKIKITALTLLALLGFHMQASAKNGDIVLNPSKSVIVFAETDNGPVSIAVNNLLSDFEKVCGTKPNVTDKIPEGCPSIVVLNRSNNVMGLNLEKMPSLDGEESHRVWVDKDQDRIYLDGADMRGTIYAIYTFSEQFLGVPPLWFWSSWVPDMKKNIKVPASTDLFFKSPQVKFRSWLPNDTDLYGMWTRKHREYQDIVCETMLRLKLNTYEVGGLAYPGVNSGMLQCKKNGLIVTSHHIVMLNTTFGSWPIYWRRVKKAEVVPELTLENIDLVKEFWEYGAQQVIESGCENIWNIAFRGSGDQPFWELFKDAPEDEPSRAAIINEMLQIQVDIIKKYSGEENPNIRITFYDEMADLVNSGLVVPPEASNMVWTFCSGRRDHYPYDDIQKFNPATPVKLGYYMNLQFTSTGSHLAPGEGPWKMEFNYRYVNSKSPLFLSVLNSGNFREFMYTMTANAKMLWDYDAYDSDAWNREYAEQYFGSKYADEIASLYKEYFYSYWTQRKSDFPGGMDRQFIFHDMRHARAIENIAKDFFNYTPFPMPDYYAYERVKGRVFRIIPEDNGVDTQVDAILKGMKMSSARFAEVSAKGSRLMNKLDKDKRTFFYDNLLCYSGYMQHLSLALYHFTYAYKNQNDKDVLLDNLNRSLTEVTAAADALYASQHGPFSDWYAGDSNLGLNKLKQTIQDVIDQAKNR